MMRRRPVPSMSIQSWIEPGQEQGDHDRADDQGQEHDHDRLEDRGQGGDGVVHLVVIDVGDLEQHFGQLAGFLADVHHGDDHVGEHAGGLERGDDGFAFLDGLVDLFDGVGDDTLPAVSRVMLRAWRIGTPEVTRVPRVREKRETALLRWMSPSTGILSLMRVDALRPPLVRPQMLKRNDHRCR
jgi:hypothetical protein